MTTTPHVASATECCAAVTGIAARHGNLEVRLRTTEGDLVVREPTDRLMVRALGGRGCGGDPETLVRGRDVSIELVLAALEAADAAASALVVSPSETGGRYHLRVGTLAHVREVPLASHDALALLASGRIRVQVRNA